LAALGAALHFQDVKVKMAKGRLSSSQSAFGGLRHPLDTGNSYDWNFDVLRF
jgi:hypothetical protein